MMIEEAGVTNPTGIVHFTQGGDYNGFFRVEVQTVVSKAAGSYYWTFSRVFGKECYRTWRQELLASVLTLLVSFGISSRTDPAAWTNLKVGLWSAGVVLAVFALWHLARTPFLVHRAATDTGEEIPHWGFGAVGVLIVLAIISGGYEFSIHIWPGAPAQMVKAEPGNHSLTAKTPSSEQTLSPQSAGDGQSAKSEAASPTQKKPAKRRVKPAPSQQAALQEALPKQDAPVSESTPAKPSQDNSVHVEPGGSIDQTSKGPCSPNIVGGANTVNCGPPPPPPLQLSFSQKRIPSTRTEFPFETEVRIVPNTNWSPVSVAIFCDNSVKRVEPYLEGGGMLMLTDGSWTDKDDKIALAYIGSPAARPDKPLLVHIYSKESMFVLKVEPANIKNLPFAQ
jgi:hypothetical protein